MMRRVAWAFGVALLAACASSSSPTQRSASVRYVAVSTTCSSVIPVAFSIDGQLVGTDTFRIDAGPSVHVVSSDFMTTAGHHVVGAHVTSNTSFAWPDASVDLAAGAVFVDSLSFYCS